MPQRFIRHNKFTRAGIVDMKKVFALQRNTDQVTEFKNGKKLFAVPAKLVQGMKTMRT